MVYGSETPPLFATNYSPLYRHNQPIPLQFDFLTQIETSAFPMAQAIRPRRYADGEELTPPQTQYTYPTADIERLRWFDDPGVCLSIDAADVNAAGRAYELGRALLQSQGTGVVETIAVFWDVEALSENGVELFEFSSFPPEAHPCALPIVHPDPQVTEPLRIRFEVVAEGIPEIDNTGFGFPRLANVVPQAIPSGEPVLPSWADNRYGWGTRYTKSQQFVVGGRVLLRLFAVVRGTPNRWKIRRLKGRLQGWWHSGGPRGAALRSAIERV